MKTLLLVDFAALWWHSWHATADAELSQARELTVEAIVTESKRHDHTAVLVDSPSSFRRDIFPDYKANREAKPKQAISQMLRTIAALQQLGLHTFEADTFEGDDLIATFCCWAGLDFAVTMFGCDKDLFQLLAPNVCLLNHRTGKAVEVATLAERGITPHQIPDWLALMGDKADNLPGVRLVGEVKAAALLKKWENLEGIYDRLHSHATDFTAGLAKDLRDAEATIYQVRSLATLSRNAPIDCDRVLVQAERSAGKPSQYWLRLSGDDDPPHAATTPPPPKEPPVTQQEPQKPNGNGAPAFSLASASRGIQHRPVRALVYGIEGVGKSSFAGSAPSPIFLDTDDGTAELDVTRQQIGSWIELIGYVDALERDKHDFKTAVIDTLDRAEALCWDAVCQEGGKKSLGDFDFGDGYAMAITKWRDLCARLDVLRNKRGMNVILVAHCWIKSFANPEGESFDRYELKLHAKSAGFLKGWCDAVLFAQYETHTKKDARKKVIGIADGTRVLRTERRAAFDAKNRYDLPDTIPLSWDDLAAAIAARQTEPASALVERIEAMLTKAPVELAATVRAKVTEANGDARMLARIANRLAAKTEVAA